jgi:hypothetical protein
MRLAHIPSAETTDLINMLSVIPPGVEKSASVKRRYIPQIPRSRPEPPSPRDVIRAIRERRRKEGDLELFDEFAA